MNSVQRLSLVLLLGLTTLEQSFATSRATGTNPLVRSFSMEDLSADTRAALQSSVKISSQADAFNVCSELMANYGAYFVSDNEAVLDPSTAGIDPQRAARIKDQRKKMRESIEACLQNPSLCMSNADKRKEFIAHISVLSRAKDIRRVLLECNSNYVLMQSAAPTLVMGKEEAQRSGVSPGENVEAELAPIDPKKPAVFKFDRELVIKIERDARRFQSQRSQNGAALSADLRAYMDFTLEAMGSVSPSYNLASRREQVNGQESDVIAYAPTTFSGRRPAAAREMPMDKDLAAASRQFAPTVEQIVDAHLKDPSAALPDTLREVEKDARDSSLSLTAERDQVVDVNQIVDQAVRDRRDQLIREGRDPASVDINLDGGEAKFRAFINDIWPKPTLSN